MDRESTRSNCSGSSDLRQLRTGRRGFSPAALALLVALAGSASPAAALSILHSHRTEERAPQSALVLDGTGYLYGTTLSGGVSGDGIGTVFRVRTDGTGYQVLRSFAGGPADGAFPYASLLLDGSFLYGTTYLGGLSNEGTVFRIGTDGTGFQLLHSFGYYPGDGTNPRGSLVLDGAGNLYGTTEGGGSADLGTLFRMRKDGTAFQTIRSFAGGSTDGSRPYASPILDASGYLCGTTYSGGTSSRGTVYRIRTDGTGFQLLHSFSSAPSDGKDPNAPLVADGAGNLYGTTLTGGPLSHGSLFTVKTDGTGYQLLHLFEGSTTDGSEPYSPLLLDGAGLLYGTTANGGSADRGTLFRLRTDGTGYQLVRSFSEEASDGRTPYGPPILDASGNLFGTTGFGGSTNAGTVYSVRTDGTSFRLLHSFAGAPTDGTGPYASLAADGSGFLYGTTIRGGPSNLGTVFRIRMDGTGFQLLHSFGRGKSDGDTPFAPVVLDGAGNLYGTTGYGGAADMGTVFRLKTDGTGFQLLHSFAGGTDDGSLPFSAVLLDGAGNLYGTTVFGGPADRGTVFRLRTDGTGYQGLRPFLGTGGDGVYPYSSLVLDGAGNLYGTTVAGGTSGRGTLFRLGTDGSGYVVLHRFAGGAAGGKIPYASPVLDGAGNLYGTTQYGGASDVGTAYAMKTDGTGFRLLHAFAKDGSDGMSPYAPLLLDGSGNLYGTTYGGGASANGTAFTVKTDGTGYRQLYAFTGCPGDGSAPRGALVLDGSGKLYGTTYAGGPGNVGTVFRMDPCTSPAPVVSVVSGTNPVCAGGSVTLDAGGGYGSYLWSTGATSRMITVSPAVTTAYSVQVTAAGCENPGPAGSLTVAVSPVPSTPILTVPLAARPGQSFSASVTAVAGMTYRWTVTGDGTLAAGQGTASVTIAAGAEGTIGVKVAATSAAGCASAEASARVTVADPSTLLYLQGGKVSVRVSWRSQYSGETGTAIAIPKADPYGYFYFSDANNPEVFVKVLDFGAGSPYLLFWAGLTDFEYKVTFTNVATNASVSFTKPAGSTAGGADTTGLPHARALPGDAETVSAADTLLDLVPGAAGPATAGEILLAKGQVGVSVTWRSQYSGQSGVATPIPQKDEFCFFYFSSQQNPEVFVKVLDWGSPEPFRIFAAGLTDFEYAVTFRNVRTGESVVFGKKAGTYDGYAAAMAR